MDNQNTVAPAASPSPSEGAGAPVDERFRDLVEGLDAIVWEMDVESWCFTYVSPRAERLLGYPPERWYGDPAFWPDRLVHPEDRGWAVPFCASATADGRDHEFDYRAVAADGRVVWMRDVVKVVSDESGAPRLLRGVMVDVTRQKEAERRLQERVRHAALSADVGDAIAGGGTLPEILQRCAAALVKHLDAAFARVWTLDEAEQVLELRASAGLYTHLDGAHGRVPVGSFKIGLIARERAPHLTNDVRNDPRVSDKEWARREGMVSFAGYPLVVEGRVVGVLGMFARHALDDSTLDALRGVAERVALIVERKETEVALRDRETQLAEAQRIAHLGSWEWDVASGRVHWSDELFRIYGLRPQSEACTLESYLARVHPEDRERIRARIGEAYREGGTFEFEERVVRPDGSVRVLLSRGRAVTDAGGAVARLVGTCQDVTERREADAREIDLAREQAARLRAEEEEERAAFLAEAGRVLSSSLDYATTLRNFAHLAVPRLADWCAIDVVDEEGAVRRVVTAHPDPAREALARELERRYPSDPDAPTGVPRVLRTGEPELVPEIPPELIETGAVDAEHLRILRELELRSYMVLPLLARGRTLGAITFVAAESGRRFAEDDLRFAQELASRAALAVDNARLFRNAEAARGQVTQILESITDAFFAVDVDWRFRYLNREAEALLRRPADELLGRGLWEEFPEAAGSTFWEMYHRAVRERRTVQFEEFFPPLDTWFEVRAYPSEEGLSVYFRDIDERKAGEAALEESERRYRFLAEAVPVQIWTALPDGSLDYVSEQTAAFFGRSAEEVVGQGWLDVVHPDEAARVVERWTRSLRTEEPYEVEFRLRGADGEYRWFLARAVPLRDEAGRVLRWFGSNTDIGDRKRAEQERERLIAALDAERSRLREIFQRAPAFIATLRGPAHVFESANPHYVRLVGGREVVGRPVAEALPEVAGQGFIDLLDEVYRSGEPFVGDEVPVLLARTPGAALEESFLNFVYQPLREIDGSVSGIFVHGVDVTDQVRARRQVEQKAEELTRLARQLEATNRELDQFAYVASHDLKAPLRGIANLSQWIEEDLEGEINRDVREHLDLLRGRVHRMEGLIDGILEYSRAGRVRERPERVAVGELLAEVVDLLSPPEGFEVRVAPGMPTLVTERLPLQQVLMNLVGNAAKYSAGPGGRVEVSAEAEGAFHHFVVADDGPGIAPEYHERIFGIFQTLEARDKVEGTGIGLSLVKKIVEARGGRVWVESEEGAGAAFHFLWPTEAQP